MKLITRIKNFIELGNRLERLSISYLNDVKVKSHFSFVINEAIQLNPWFTKSSILTALKAIALNLKKDKLENWIANYPKIKNDKKNSKTIGVVMAGNIPLVGFHDFLCTIISGHRFKGKPSSKDGGLMQFITNQLIDIDSEFQHLTHLEKNHLSAIDAIIATGSDNTSRYFEYYFSRYPHIIRKNRNSAAVLSGNETIHELKGLADDIFLYFGLGCRSISKLLVPERYDFKKFLNTIDCYNFVIDHHKYANNYNYHKAIYLINKQPHLDNGFLLLKEDDNYTSPIGVLFYEFYSDISKLQTRLKNDNDKLQCVASVINDIKPKVPFGKSQFPELTDYADNIDTLDFLLNL